MRSSKLKDVIVRPEEGHLLFFVNKADTFAMGLFHVSHELEAYLHVPSPSTCLSPPPSNLHCVNGDGPFDGQNGFWTHSAHQTVHPRWHYDKL